MANNLGMEQDIVTK